MVPVGSRFCRWCGRNWPREPEYVSCPGCREDTTMSGKVPLDAAEARTTRLHLEFGWWLWEHGRL